MPVEHAPDDGAAKPETSRAREEASASWTAITAISMARGSRSGAAVPSFLAWGRRFRDRRGGHV